MALLQALFTLVGRSAGKILNLVFGWAVRALFGTPPGSQETLLTLLVAAAALWPVLLAGVVAPRIASFVVAFVPVGGEIPEAPLRIAWLALALLVPAIVGLVLAAKAPPGTRSEPFLVRAARGFPITLGIAVAFLVSAVTIPVLRVVSALRGHQHVMVPLITPEPAYAGVATRIRDVLNEHGLGVAPREPGWWVEVPLRVLRRLGGRALGPFVPKHVAHFAGPELEGTLHPSGLLLRGDPGKTTVAHGLVVEAMTPLGTLQTTTPEAQHLERQIRRVWQVLDEHPAHVGSPWLARRVDEISAALLGLEAPYDDWQTVYRQTLQLGRALRGDAPLLQSAVPAGTAASLPGRASEGGFPIQHDDVSMAAAMQPGAPRGARPENGGREGPGAQLSTLELVREIGQKATQLARKEFELARVELRADVQSQIAMAKALGVAAVGAIATVNLLLVALVFALVPTLQPWAAALVVAGGVAVLTAIAGIVGWRKRVTKPLARTRKTLEEDVQWAKERLA